MATVRSQGAAIFSSKQGAPPNNLHRFVTTGKALIDRASENRPSPLPTSISQLDRTLAGGLPRGGLIEVTGRQSCGRFSLALSALAATTATGEVAALVDLGNGLDPTNALAMGVDLRRLLWLRPKHLQPALAAAEIALQTGFPLVVIDLGEPPIRGGRGPEAAWLRLARAAATHRSSVFVSSPYRVSGTAAKTVLETERAIPHWSGGGCAPRLLEALEFHWLLQKTSGNAVNQSVSFALTAPNAYLGDTRHFGDTRPTGVPSQPAFEASDGARTAVESHEQTVKTELDHYRTTRSA